MCKGPEAEAGLDVLEATQEVQLRWSKDAWEKMEPDELLLKALNEPLAFLEDSLCAWHWAPSAPQKGSETNHRS